MARHQSAFVNWSQYLALRGMAALVSCFDVDQNLHSAKVVGEIYARLHPHRVERAQRNLALSFPEWDDARVQEVARRSFEYLFRLFMVDAIVTPQLITPAAWPDYVHIDGSTRPAIDRLVRSEPAIFVTGHCGNWELLGFVLSVIGYPLDAVARPIDNPLVDRWLRSMRESRGMRIITKWGASEAFGRVLESGGRLAFIADQNAGDQGLFVPFFGRLASCYKSIGLLALRYEVPVIAGHAYRVGDRMRYHVHVQDVIEPADWVDQPDPLFYVTARFSRAIEQMVRLAPEQYLWLHRRWKSRPRHERQGKPMPGRLRSKLEALPWMTETELERIVSLSNDPQHVEMR